MNRFLRITALIILSASTCMAANRKEKEAKKLQNIDTVTIEAQIPFVPNVTIFTPTTKIYDDAVDIIEFAGYTVYDRNNNAVLKVASSIDKPTRLKLDKGDYIVQLEGQKSPVYSISVIENQYNEFVIQ